MVVIAERNQGRALDAGADVAAGALAMSLAGTSEHPFKPFGDALKECMRWGCGLQGRSYDMIREEWDDRRLLDAIGAAGGRCGLSWLTKLKSGERRPSEDLFNIIVSERVFGKQFVVPKTTQSQGPPPEKLAAWQDLKKRQDDALTTLYRAWNAAKAAAPDRRSRKWRSSKNAGGQAEAQAVDPEQQPTPRGANADRQAAGEARATAASSKARYYLQFLPNPMPYYANRDVVSVALDNQEPAPDAYLDIVPSASFPKHGYPAKITKAQLRVITRREWRRATDRRAELIDELKDIVIRGLNGIQARLYPDPRHVVRELAEKPGEYEALNCHVCDFEVEDGSPLYDVYIRMSRERPLLKFTGAARGHKVQMQLVTQLEHVRVEEPNVESPRKKKVIELLRLHKARMLPDPDRGYIVLVDVLYQVEEE
jgi:hypothetical protein